MFFSKHCVVNCWAKVRKVMNRFNFITVNLTKKDCFPGGPISMYFTIYIYQRNVPGGGASQTNLQKQIRLCMVLLIREVCTFNFQK